MGISIRCEKCGTGFSAPPKLAGKRVKCSRCSHPILVPTASTPGVIKLSDADLDGPPTPKPTAAPAGQTENVIKLTDQHLVAPTPAARPASAAVAHGGAAQHAPLTPKPLDPYDDPNSPDYLPPWTEPVGSVGNSSTMLWMLIGGGGVGLAIVIVGIFLAIRSGPATPTPATAQQSQTNPLDSPRRGGQSSNRSSSQSATNGRYGSTSPVRTGSTATSINRSSTGTTPPFNDSSSSPLGQSNSSATQPTGTANSSSTTGSNGNATAEPATEVAPVADFWKVTPDPPTESYEVPPKRISFPFPSTGEVHFAPTDSPFICVTRNDSGARTQVLLDLRTSKVVGAVQQTFMPMTDLAYSIDGTHLAGTSEKDDKFRIFSTAKGEKLAEIDKQERFVKLEFGPSSDLLFIYRGDEPSSSYSRRSSSNNSAPAAGRLERWTLEGPAKAEEASLPPSLAPERMALSPGRQQLALVSEGKLHVYQVQEITKLGLASLPTEVAEMECLGLAYSHSGSELAAIFQKRYGNYLLVCWDIPSGKSVLTHEYDSESFNTKSYVSRSYGGPKVAWIPDGSGWLLFGHQLVDRNTGEVLLAIPESGSKARRFVGNDRLLGVSQKYGNSGDGFIGTADMPMAELGKMQAAVRAGNKALDGRLGKLLNVNFEDAADRPALANRTTWTAVIGPAPKSAPYPKKPLPLDMPPNVQDIHFSDTDSKYVGILASANSHESLLRRYNLSGHNEAGQFAIPVSSSLKDLSPSGALALTCTNGPNPQDRDRLDIYSFQENAHVIGWRPYRSLAKLEPTATGVTWAAFQGEDHVLTLNQLETLVRWKIPEMTPVWQIKDFGQIAAFSPDSRFLVSNSRQVIEAASGNSVGRLEAPAYEPRIEALAFSADGKSILASASAGYEEKFVIEWDATSGKLTSQFWYAPGQMNTRTGSLQVLGDRHVLVNGASLVNLDRKALIWEYRTLNAAPTAGPDGYVWLALAPRTAPQRKSLTAVKLPHPLAQQKMATATFYNQVLLYPGAKFNAADGNLAQQMQQQGFILDPSATVTASAGSSQESTGRTVEYTQIGKPGATTRVEEKVMRHTFTIADNRGRAWTRKTSSGMGLGSVIRTSGTDLQQHLDQRLQSSAAGFQQSLNVPRCVFPDYEHLGITPSNITLDGIQDIPSPRPATTGSTP